MALLGIRVLGDPILRQTTTPVTDFGPGLQALIDDMFDLRPGAIIRDLKANDLNVVTYQMDLQRKIAAPLMTLVMTLIALPLGVTTGKRGALYGIGLAIALSFAYQIAFTAFGFLGAAELLPATLAAWAPNLLFLAGASYLLLTVRT